MWVLTKWSYFGSIRNNLSDFLRTIEYITVTYNAVTTYLNAFPK